MRALLGASNGEVQEDSEVKAVADLCVHCHMCRIECPAEVDIPRLVVETKSRHVRTNGLRLSDWLMVHVDDVTSLSRRVRHLSNWALGSPTARWLLEKGIGLARSRRLPTLERRSFLEEARRRRLTVPAPGPRKVAYFVDTYVNHFDTELGLALAAVLAHNGVMVWVPPGQVHSGMPMIARGAVDAAREVARTNAAVLAEAVRQGYTIVATEPSAVLALTREYLALLPGDSDAQSVSENTMEACHYLWHMHQEQKLRLDFKRLVATVGYHAPCHLLALGIGTPAENLLRLVPHLQVKRLEHGCSGMAGTYGLQQKNFRNSLRAGLGLISALRNTPLSAGTTECSTCRIQMQHGTDRPTIHPLKLLALAYGLMPELKRHLHSGARELTLS
jgi:Fe-S oxidoreductase